MRDFAVIIDTTSDAEELMSKGDDDDEAYGGFYTPISS